MKKPYLSPTSMVLLLEPSSMLAASSPSDIISPTNEHETEEQYSNWKQFDADSNESGEWEW